MRNAGYTFYPPYLLEMRILTVARDRQDRQLIEEALRNGGYQPTALFSRGREALVHIQHHVVDLVITTRRLQDMDGPSVARAMELEGEDQTPVLMICEQIRQDELIDALDHGIDNVLLKPFNADDLKEKVSSLSTPALQIPVGSIPGNTFLQAAEKTSATESDPQMISEE